MERYGPVPAILADYAAANPPYGSRADHSGLKFMATPLMQ